MDGSAYLPGCPGPQHLENKLPMFQAVAGTHLNSLQSTHTCAHTHTKLRDYVPAPRLERTVLVASALLGDPAAVRDLVVEQLLRATPLEGRLAKRGTIGRNGVVPGRHRVMARVGRSGGTRHRVWTPRADGLVSCRLFLLRSGGSGVDEVTNGTLQGREFGRPTDLELFLHVDVVHRGQVGASDLELLKSGHEVGQVDVRQPVGHHLHVPVLKVLDIECHGRQRRVDDSAHP